MSQNTAENRCVWFEIPVGDLKRAQAFYQTVFETELHDEQGSPNPMLVFPTRDNSGVGGHLYEGKPAAGGEGPTVHLGVDGSLEDALERVRTNGGAVLSEIISIPPGRFAYCRDPDGNSIGLFKAA